MSYVMMGASSDTLSLFQEFESGLNNLVSTASNDTQSIVAQISDWRNAVTLGAAKRAAREWAANIVNYTQSVRSTLLDKRGGTQPYYQRVPEQARRLLQTARDDLRGLIEDFKSSADELLGDVQMFQQALDMLLQFLLRVIDMILKALGKASLQFPLAALAVAVGLGGFLYWRFR